MFKPVSVHFIKDKTNSKTNNVLILSYFSNTIEVSHESKTALIITGNKKLVIALDAFCNHSTSVLY